MKNGLITLSRELRFGLLAADRSTASENGFAGNPALTGVGPFLTLAAKVRGAIDPATGMLVNIKDIDRVLRQRAVPAVRTYYHAGPNRGAGDLVVGLLDSLHKTFLPHQLFSLELGLSPYLKISANATEPAMACVSERFEFSAAHRLHADTLSEKENWEVFGKCNNPHGHGHNYELEITLAGEPDVQTGQVFPIREIQRVVNGLVIDVFDHKHLNLDCVEFAKLNPTVENIARVIFQKLRGGFPGRVRLKQVKIWETPKTFAEYGED